MHACMCTKMQMSFTKERDSISRLVSAQLLGGYSGAPHIPPGQLRCESLNARILCRRVVASSSSSSEIFGSLTWIRLFEICNSIFEVRSWLRSLNKSPICWSFSDFVYWWESSILLIYSVLFSSSSVCFDKTCSFFLFASSSANCYWRLASFSFSYCYYFRS